MGADGGDVPWSSPLDAARVTAGSDRLEALVVTSAAMWWSEGRPSEDGRVQIVRRDDDATRTDVLPAPHSARSRVHEYGGGAFWVHEGIVFFVDDADQRIWRIDAGAEPTPLTPASNGRHGRRHADGVVTPDGRWIVCVSEIHPGEVDGPPEGSEARNVIVAVPSSGGAPHVMVGGSDFVSSPRISTDGSWLAWLSWDHPDMPWDSTALWVGSLSEDADGRLTVTAAAAVAGGPGESIVQPEWDLDDRLWFCSDRSDWSKLHHFPTPGRPTGDPIAVDHGSGDVALPAWVFGESRYAMLSDRRVVFAYSLDGVDHLASYDPISGRVDRLSVGATEIRQVRADLATVVFVGASFTSEVSVTATMVGRGGATSPTTAIRAPRSSPLSSSFISVGRPVTFPTTDGASAHGIFYPPTNPDHVPAVARPPLIVTIHGGPTAAASPRLALRTQFWTSRGFACIDVNYRGSTGFGRRYRESLNGRWGLADVDDCIAAATFLAEGGQVDPARILIRGSSAGGFTVLSALAGAEVFAAGCVLYGVTDLEALARDTHKFESRYLDRLVAPYPEHREVYVERSPLSHVDRLDRPVIVFQGSDDAVVPPSQSRAIVEALAQRGVPHAYVEFAGEGHGFRRADNVTRCLEGELSFYCQVLGLDHPADIEPVAVAPARPPGSDVGELRPDN